MKCLIVEDNKQNYDLLQLMLKKYGLSDIAINGEEAIDMFIAAHTEEEPYNIIFLDIMMPGIDGNEVLRNIRNWEEKNLESGGKVQVVMASSKTDTDTILSSYDDGCQHFFMKPYDKVELDELMKKMGFSESTEDLS